MRIPMHIHMHLHLHMHVHVHIHMHIQVYTCMPACMRKYIHTCTPANTYTHTYTHSCLSVLVELRDDTTFAWVRGCNLSTYAHKYIHTERHTSIHTYVNKHIHTYTHRSVITCTDIHVDVDVHFGKHLCFMLSLLCDALHAWMVMALVPYPVCRSIRLPRLSPHPAHSASQAPPPPCERTMLSHRPAVCALYPLPPPRAYPPNPL